MNKLSLNQNFTIANDPVVSDIQTEEKKKDIESRTISLNKFIRIVRNKLKEYPSFSLLLGAGCSVYSNIRSASELIAEWKKQIYFDQFNEKQEEAISNEMIDKYITSMPGYDSNHEYSYLFEQLYDTPSQRRVFIEQEIDEKFPSIGYAYMVKLFESGYFSTIFTTNFDDLANEAFYIYSQTHKRPIVCDEGSHISSITVTSNRPKIIKLHGDYLYDNIRATKEETSSLNSEIGAKFKDFAHETGLIIIGYSCGDDSVMDAIESILDSDTGFKNGIYWCFRKNEAIPGKLLTLIENEQRKENNTKESDKDSYHRKNFIVRIDGFDETMCELAVKLVKDFSIINSINPINDRIITDLCDNTHYTKSSSTTFREELKRLSIEAKRIERFFRLSRDTNKQFLEENEEENPFSSKLMEYEILEAQEKYDEIIQKIETNINCTIDNYKFFEIKMKAYYMLHDYINAIKLADTLIQYDNNNELYYINKSFCCQNDEEKLKALEEGLSILPNSSLLLLQEAHIYAKKSKISLNYEDDCYQKAKDLYLRIMENNVSPEENTVCYLFDLFIDKENKEEAYKIVNKLNEKNSNAFNSIQLQVKYWLKFEKEKPTEEIISYINDMHRCPKPQITKIELLKAKVYKDKNSIKDLKNFCLKKPKFQYQENMRMIAEIIYKKFRDLELAIVCLEKALTKEWNLNTAIDLFSYYCDAGNIENARKIYNNKHINKEQLNDRFWSANKDWQQIINANKSKIEEHTDDLTCYINYTHALLQTNNYDAVKDLINPFIQNGHETNEYLIINYELAKSASNNNKKSKNDRVKKIIASNNKTIQIGGQILQGNQDTAKELAINEIETDFSKLHEFDNMYIFHSSLVDKNFLEEVEKKLKPLEDSFTKDEKEIIKSF
ncbi:MAG: SIR2 family protein [Spirochaetales bacterium]|nr:SIR2 family protein [Spirochaetales bacterium]